MSSCAILAEIGKSYTLHHILLMRALIYNNMSEIVDVRPYPSESPRSVQFFVTGPGRFRTNPFNKEKHMVFRDYVTRFLSSIMLCIKARGFDYLIVDTATTAITVAPILTLLRADTKLMVSSFNVPRRRTGLALHLIRLACKRIDHLFVHSRSDIEIISKTLRIEPKRISFRLFERDEPASGEPDPRYRPSGQRPFIMSFGSNGRDYGTLFSAVAGLGIPVLVVAREWNIRNLDIPEEVTVLYNIPLAECERLVGSCLFTVFTLDCSEPSCGQISFITAMMKRKAIVATEWIGTIDYIFHNQNGFLVKPFDRDNLRDAILKLWHDGSLREQLAEAGHDLVKNSSAQRSLDLYESLILR